MADTDAKPLIETAIQLARESMRQGRGGPFGAVIVQENRIIATGTNQVLAANDPTAHAEIVAIRAAGEALGRFHLPDCEIYSTCEPCPMCLGAIYWARLRAVCFVSSRHDAARAGFADDFIYQELPKPPAERSLPMKQLAHPDAEALIKEWIGMGGKRMY